jgi:hypothetical protein
MDRRWINVIAVLGVIAAAASGCATQHRQRPEQGQQEHKAQAAALAERGRALKISGDYAGALALFEQSLRLDPDQPRVHFDAVTVLRRMPVRGPDDHNIREFLEAHGDQRLDAYERETPHLKAFLRGTRIGAPHSPGEVADADIEEANFLGYSGRISRDPMFPERLRPRARQLESARREMLFSVLEEKKSRGETDFVVRTGLIHGLLIGATDDAQEADIRSRALRLYHDITADPYAIETILSGNNTAALRDGPAAAPFDRLLEEASQYRDKAVVTAVAQVRRDTARRRGARAQPATRVVAAPSTRSTVTTTSVRTPGGRTQRSPVGRASPASVPTAGTVTLERSDSVATDAENQPAAVPSRISDYLRCGDDIDLVVALKDLYLMKQKGRLRRMYHSDERFFNFVGVCFDGKYVWAPVKRPQPMLLVIDPATEQVWTLGGADNPLPPTSGGAEAAPLAPGRVLLAGAEAGQNGSAWLADVRFNPQAPADARARVEVFFNANERHDDFDHQAWRNLHEAFTPTWMVALIDPAAQRRRVLVGRSDHPLLVDPDARIVQVLNDSVSSTIGGKNFAVREGNLYWAIPTLGGEGRGKLCRFGLPDLRRETLQDGLPTDDGSVVLDNDGRRVHLVADRWYTAPAIGERFRPLAYVNPGGSAGNGRLPGVWYYRTIAHSSHYGLVLLDQTDAGGAYAVTLSYDRRP